MSGATVEAFHKFNSRNTSGLFSRVTEHQPPPRSRTFAVCGRLNKVLYLYSKVIQGGVVKS